MREMGARRCPPGGKKVCSRAASAIGAGGPAVSLLHSEGEAVSRVRSHISPGPYRSFRELSLAGSVDPVTWCPPTFVGNSGIERSNGHRGFALYLVGYDLLSSWPGIADRRTASLPLAYVPAIHVFSMRAKKDVDTRHKAGHDGNQCRASLLPWKHKKQRC